MAVQDQTATTAARALFDHLVYIFGPPEYVHSDNKPALSPKHSIFCVKTVNAKRNYPTPQLWNWHGNLVLLRKDLSDEEYAIEKSRRTWKKIHDVVKKKNARITEDKQKKHYERLTVHASLLRLTGKFR